MHALTLLITAGGSHTTSAYDYFALIKCGVRTTCWSVQQQGYGCMERSHRYCLADGINLQLQNCKWLDTREHCLFAVIRS